MDKYYRAKKDTFLWKEGAILRNNANGGGYQPIEDVWNATPHNGTEYISSRIIEAPENAGFFERVYRDDLSGKAYRTKDQIVAAYNEAFKK